MKIFKRRDVFGCADLAFFAGRFDQIHVVRVWMCERIVRDFFDQRQKFNLDSVWIAHGSSPKNCVGGTHSVRLGRTSAFSLLSVVLGAL